MKIGGKIFFFFEGGEGKARKRDLLPYIKRTVRHYFKPLKERDCVSTVVSISLSTVSGSQQVVRLHPRACKLCPCPITRPKIEPGASNRDSSVLMDGGLSRV